VNCLSAGGLLAPVSFDYWSVLVAKKSTRARPEVPARARFGIPGLDEILNGGLPSRHMYLIDGDPGTGKTTVGLQFLMEGRDLGERGMYVTLSETTAELRGSAESHGWDIEGIDIFELDDTEAGGSTEVYTLFHPSEIELQETVETVLDAIRTKMPKRVVIDSLSEMRLLAREPLRFRRQILALKQFSPARTARSSVWTIAARPKATCSCTVLPMA
jgi:circadian clock protein KaiC